MALSPLSYMISKSSLAIKRLRRRLSQRGSRRQSSPAPESMEAADKRLFKPSSAAPESREVVDKRLFKSVRTEIRTVRNSRKVFRAPFPLVLRDIPGGKSIKLRTWLGGERIEMDVGEDGGHIVRVRDPFNFDYKHDPHGHWRRYGDPPDEKETDTSDESQEVENEADESEEEENEGVSYHLPITMGIMKVHDKGLRVKLIAEVDVAGNHRIRLISATFEDYNSNEEMVENRLGPDLDELSEDVKSDLIKYLEVRGLNKGSIKFLHQYMAAKFRWECLDWMKELKQFIGTEPNLRDGPYPGKVHIDLGVSCRDVEETDK